MGLTTEMWDLDLSQLATEATFVPVDWGYSGRPNLRAVLPPVAQGGRSLVLNGHIDVVSPEPVDWWTYDPWGATLTDGRMYGRGALDMQSELVSALLAMQAVIDAGVELEGPVIFESVIEEECTGNGMLACRLRSGTVDGAVITEPTGLLAKMATLGVVCSRSRCVESLPTSAKQANTKTQLRKPWPWSADSSHPWLSN